MVPLPSSGAEYPPESPQSSPSDRPHTSSNGTYKGAAWQGHSHSKKRCGLACRWSWCWECSSRRLTWEDYGLRGRPGTMGWGRCYSFFLGKLAGHNVITKNRRKTLWRWCLQIKFDRLACVTYMSFLFPIRIVTTRKLTAWTGMVQWHVGVYVIWQFPDSDAFGRCYRHPLHSA
jgi:hypothetical protein